ncbi:hypothetical protein LINPERPRIM_LOCUS3017 [Linum perenne]
MQLDSRAAIQLLLGDGEVTHHYYSAIVSFREMLNWDRMVKVEHIYRECNRADDFLAGSRQSL